MSMPVSEKEKRSKEIGQRMLPEPTLPSRHGIYFITWRGRFCASTKYGKNVILHGMRFELYGKDLSEVKVTNRYFDSEETMAEFMGRWEGSANYEDVAFDR